MNHIKDKLVDNEYYHGTFDYKAIQILYEGFRLKKRYCDWGRTGTFKEGIYLTKSIDVAEMFAYGDVIFKCRLSDKISILRIDEKYEKKIIDYLRREFGRNILTGDISKAMPANKHLTKKELINLINYRFSRMGYWKGNDIWKWDAVIPSVRHQLKLHKYDAVGNAENMAGIAVFNPAFVKPLKMFHFGYKGIKPFLKELDKKKFASDLKQTISEHREYCDNDNEREGLDYIESLLQRYRKENSIENGTINM
jgi:hypothetical protein